MEKFIMLFAVVCMSISSCRKEIAPEPCTDPLNPNCINYHPCNGVQPVTADFEMWYYDRISDFKIHEDSIFPPGTILFKAKLNGAQYQWLLGKDTETVQLDYRIFGAAPPDTIYGTYNNSLTVWKTPNKNCYPNDLATASLTRKITIVRPSKLQTTGVFKVLFDGYADSNIIQIQPWAQNFPYNPNADRERISDRIFIGFKDTRSDTLSFGTANGDYYYMNTIIYLGTYDGPGIPFGGKITVDPASQTIVGNYTIELKGTEIKKQHHFKGRRL